MAGFVVFGGTAEGRLLAEAFRDTAVTADICVATEYGASLLPKAANIRIRAGRMEEEEIERFLRRDGILCCVDATHPYAEAVTRNLVGVCGRIGLPYIRILREETETREEGARLHLVENTEQAVDFLAGTAGNILITTGSKELEQYTRIPEYQSRCYARVLPTVPVMEKCRELGFEGRNLIAMQGPFSEELNYCMLKQVNAAWMVTKSSGKAGGYQEKCEAAIRAGADILVIARPKEPLEGTAACGGEGKEAASARTLCVTMSLPEAIAYLKRQFRIVAKRKLYLIGMGPGSPGLLTQEARACLERADAVIGAGRVLSVWPEYRRKPYLESYRKEEIAAYLRSHPEFQEAAVVFSGDIGFYSGAKGIRESLPEYEICSLAGISSPLYFLDRLGIPWEDVRLVSSHGQEPDLLSLIRDHSRVCTLLGKKDTVSLLCRKLVEYGMKDVRVTVGERLSYPEERITAGWPQELTEAPFDTLSVALFENLCPRQRIMTPGIEDECFSRGKAPMTKQEIRTLSLSRLKLREDSVLYDIGAGTGSVSIEAALLCGQGRVYAVEKDPEAVRLLYENRRKFRTDNIEILEGEAPDCLEGLPAPTHAFIGGSGGRMTEIIRRIRDKNPGVRFVVNAVTLETIAGMEEVRRLFPEYGTMQAVQVSAAKSRPLGRYHLMRAENPVMIFCFGGEGDGE